MYGICNLKHDKYEAATSCRMKFDRKEKMLTKKEKYGIL